MPGLYVEDSSVEDSSVEDSSVEEAAAEDGDEVEVDMEGRKCVKEDGCSVTDGEETGRADSLSMLDDENMVG